jgi:hypothetical protein
MYGHALIIVKLCPHCADPTPGVFASASDPLTLLCVEHAMDELDNARACA